MSLKHVWRQFLVGWNWLIDHTISRRIIILTLGLVVYPIYGLFKGISEDW